MLMGGNLNILYGPSNSWRDDEKAQITTIFQMTDKRCESEGICKKTESNPAVVMVRLNFSIIQAIRG